MRTDELRERIAEALRDAQHVSTHEPEDSYFDLTHDVFCAVCRGDVYHLADAVIAVLEAHGTGSKFDQPEEGHDAR